MNATMRKRIEKIEVTLIRPAPMFTGTAFITTPAEDSGEQA
jgi:hypothetical protein